MNEKNKSPFSGLTKRHYLIIAVVAVLVIILIAYLISQNNDNGSSVNGTSQTTTTTAAAETTTRQTSPGTTEPVIVVPVISDWPTLMGNNERNSRSSLISNLTDPVISQSYYFGTYKGYVLIKNSNDSVGIDFSLFDETSSFSDVETKYGFNGINFEVNGMQFKKHLTQNNRILSLYDGELNHIYVSESRADPSLVVERVVGVSGPHQALWKVNLPDYHERPHIAVADMNNNGRKEIIILGWEGVLVYDSMTHELIMRLPQSALHNARKRGYLIVKDINNDNFPEVFILSSYPWDVNVINNDGSKLSTAWYKIYDNKIESAQKITSYTRNPIDDYTKDGKYEMVFNLWNEYGDGEWHVKVLDALTGKEVADIPNAYMHDAVDINGDGGLELFLSTPSGIDTPEYSDLRIVSLDSGAVRELFKYESAKWGYNIDSEYIETLGLHTAQNPKPGLKYIVLDQIDGLTAFYTYTKDGSYTNIERHTLEGIDNSFGIRYPDGTKIDLVKQTQDEGLLIEIISKNENPDGIMLNGANPEILAWQRPTNQKMRLPIIANTGDGNDIFVSNGVDQVIALTKSDGQLEEKWAVDGFGAAFQYNTWIDYGIIADDFTGDGINEFIIRVNGEKGGGVKCVDVDGNTIWQTEFPIIPSGEVYGFRGNVGFFTSANIHEDKALVVTAQRHVQHTGITFGLDGKTGEINWTLDVIRRFQNHQSGAGSYYLSVYDLNQDGVDEVMTGYGNNVWGASVDTGRTIFENFMRGFWEQKWIKDNPSGWVSNILPIPLTIEDGIVKLFFSNAGDSTGTAFVNTKVGGRETRTVLVWGNEDRWYTNRYNQCLADLSGDGRILVVEAARKDNRNVLHAYDPYTGDPVSRDYSLIGASNQAVPIACDINGDGKDNIIISYGNYLEALEVENNGFKRLWKLEFPSTLAWPVYGDIDGDGFGEIVITDVNGYIYIVDQP